MDISALDTSSFTLVIAGIWWTDDQSRRAGSYMRIWLGLLRSFKSISSYSSGSKLYYYLSKPSQRNQCDKSGCDNIWCYRTAMKRKCESQELKYKQDENGQQGKPSLSWDPIEAHWDSGERTWQSGKGARCNINRKIGGCIRPRQMEAGIQRSADHGGRC